MEDALRRADVSSETFSSFGICGATEGEKVILGVTAFLNVTGPLLDGRAAGLMRDGRYPLP